MMRLSSILALILAVGCGNVGGTNPGDDTGDDAPVIDAPPMIPDSPPPPPGFTRLIGRTWSLSPGQLDTYRCVRVTIPADMYITEIMAQAPPGTHHTVLSIAGSNGTAGPDGEQNCGVGTLGMVMLYASGVGTDPLVFPANVGIKVSAGQQVHLNLHLFNASDNQLAGDSAILVKSQPTPTTTLAEMVFAGKFLFSIPPMSVRTIVGGCTSQTTYKLFALWPHMHQLATHQKVERIRNATAQVLHDKPFAFAEQKYYPQAPEIDITPGDQIRVSCTYNNTTNQTVTFGDSSNQEMCFSGLYRYPAANAGLFQCTDNPGF